MRFVTKASGVAIPLSTRSMEKPPDIVAASGPGTLSALNVNPDAGLASAIHMSDIPSFPYQLLWEERQVASVANLTRQDGLDFLRLARDIGLLVKTTTYPLRQANDALADLRAGRFEGAAVLI